MWSDPDRDHLPDRILDFASLFLDQESDDDEATSLGQMLEALECAMMNRAGAMGRPTKGLTFTTAEIAEVINASNLDAHAIIVRDFLFSDLLNEKKATPVGIGRKLKPFERTPVRHGLRTLKLVIEMDKHANSNVYRVETVHVHVGL